jgi:hypothetical protein
MGLLYLYLKVFCLLGLWTLAVSGDRARQHILSETRLHVYQTAPRHVQEDSNLLSQGRENLADYGLRNISVANVHTHAHARTSGRYVSDGSISRPNLDMRLGAASKCQRYMRRAVRRSWEVDCVVIAHLHRQLFTWRLEGATLGTPLLPDKCSGRSAVKEWRKQRVSVLVGFHTFLWGEFRK